MAQTVNRDPEAMKARELALQRTLTVWIVTGLTFMLLPGTFLGVWNLISITGERTADLIDPAWIQAHGHAQLFGWIGSFIIGIGFYSLSKMGRLPEFAITRSWTSWALWTTGVTLRWATNLWMWEWRWMLPFSAVLELLAFLLFFLTVSGHRAEPKPESPKRGGPPVWMFAVIAGSIGFLTSLSANLAVTIQAGVSGIGPAISHGANERLLVLFTWAFPVVMIWGFSARWLPVFLGLSEPAGKVLFTALGVNAMGVVAAMLGWFVPAMIAILAASVTAAFAIHVFLPPVKAPKTIGVHSTFPLFVRFAYVWMIVAAALGVCAVFWDQAGGLWGSSRHALTVGFMSSMVFAIGQRVLPAFCGMRVLYSPKLMFWSLALLNAGCLMRVSAEIGAYESYVPAMWPLLPVSAIIEMTAVTVFAASLLLTFRQPPAHLVSAAQAR